MGKRGRKKQQTERVQIILNVSDDQEREIYEHIIGSTNNSAAGRQLLINGWLYNKDTVLIKPTNIMESGSQNSDHKIGEQINSDIEIVYNDGIKESGAMDDFYL